MKNYLALLHLTIYPWLNLVNHPYSTKLHKKYLIKVVCIMAAFHSLLRISKSKMKKSKTPITFKSNCKETLVKAGLRLIYFHRHQLQ